MENINNPEKIKKNLLKKIKSIKLCIKLYEEYDDYELNEILLNRVEQLESSILIFFTKKLDPEGASERLMNPGSYDSLIN